MILSEFKPFEEIMESLKDDNKVFLLGCKGCAEASETGGLPQLEEMKGKLEAQGKKVTGYTTLEFLCQKALVKSRLAPIKEKVLASDSVLVMSCGIGVQASANAINKYCRPACNTTPLGDTRGTWPSYERCRECGDCVLDYTGGICPLTQCSKSLLNGACGGASKGKCEVAPEKDCGWELIYHRLKDLNQLDKLKIYIPPKDFAKMEPWKLIPTTFYDIEYIEEEERGG
ncbi:MAG: 5,10-methylenetetrahydrofolate reductase [Candidatus Syntrophonatronum acetioxidans]|uniref:5,10-methylenetetrahydrofolate reductase n=1 Tax=Candidatus Syntrophonatronum acetioxidans TaxID=1795816 RepID=A0A424YDG6_9FIRM|nr:MAG: 5,10-methylenetetrahydrofolate reductase [Candidatus Syntrophonatronum acetioxidans]